MRKIYSEITEKILHIIENENLIPWTTPWFTQQFNGYLKKRYKGVNQLFLSYIVYKNQYKYPIWFTFNQVRKLGGKIKKSEKSSIVYLTKAWTPKKVSSQCKHCSHFEDGHCNAGNDQWKNDNWNEVIECEDYEGNKTFFVLQAFRVFNIAQTTLNPSDFLPLVNSNKKSLEAEKIIEKIQIDGVKVEYGAQEAAYYPEFDKITMPDKELFKSLEDYYCTFFHEIIHSTGHKKRLNRYGDNIKEYFFRSYSYEELVAEIGSVMLCKKANISINLKDSASYIKGWVNFLKNHKKAIVQASFDAEKAINYIEKIQTETPTCN